MKVPLELLDNIIGYVPRSSLHSRSLVARSWTGLCQKRHFEAVNICPRNSWKWRDKFSPRNVELLGHVRLGGGLILDQRITPSVNISPRSVNSDGSFCASPTPRCFLRGSRYSRLSITHSRLFGLVNCVTAKSKFIALLNYFPNLMHLTLCQIEYCREDSPFLDSASRS